MEAKQFVELVQEIRNLEAALGKPIKIRQNSEIPCYDKLGKTLVYTRSLQQGDKVQYKDLNMKVAIPKGAAGNTMHQIIGKILKKNVEEDESVLLTHFL